MLNVVEQEHQTWYEYDGYRALHSSSELDIFGPRAMKISLVNTNLDRKILAAGGLAVSHAFKYGLNETTVVWFRDLLEAAIATTRNPGGVSLTKIDTRDVVQFLHDVSNVSEEYVSYLFHYAQVGRLKLDVDAFYNPPPVLALEKYVKLGSYGMSTGQVYVYYEDVRLGNYNVYYGDRVYYQALLRYLLHRRTLGFSPEPDLVAELPETANVRVDWVQVAERYTSRWAYSLSKTELEEALLGVRYSLECEIAHRSHNRLLMP